MKTIEELEDRLHDYRVRKAELPDYDELQKFIVELKITFKNVAKASYIDACDHMLECLEQMR